MHCFESVCRKLRHFPVLRSIGWLWDTLRPIYDLLIRHLGQKGLVRVMNKTDTILISPSFRGISETYEPAVWNHVMTRIRPGDVIADVGAYVGLYTVAFVKRVGFEGKVYAFEPDPLNFDVLKEHIRLNDLNDRVVLSQQAVGSKDGVARLNTGLQSVSSLTKDHKQGASVDMISLDTVLYRSCLSLLKIDVEGFEEEVLRGGLRLLADHVRSPRLIYVEVHPYVWSTIGVSDRTLLKLLDDLHYDVTDLSGHPIREIKYYGEIVAYKRV